MWKVRERNIGEKIFFEVYKTTPKNETVPHSLWDYENEARKLADNMNKEEGYDERIC